MSDENPVLTEVRGPVLIITLNRPEAKNAANLALSKGVAAAIDKLDADDSLTVGIITGAGGTFCSGMDLKGFLKGERPSIPGRGFAGLTEAPPKKPLIAAVDGYALAGGMEIALSCDMIVASRSAKFGIPEVKRGLAAAAGGLILAGAILSRYPWRSVDGYIGHSPWVQLPALIALGALAASMLPEPAQLPEPAEAPDEEPGPVPDPEPEPEPEAERDADTASP